MNTATASPVLVIGALLNFASQSRWENFISGPLALVLAVLCTLVARSTAVGRRSSDENPAAALPE